MTYLTSDHWPVSTESDIKNLVRSTASLNGDLLGIGSLNFLDLSVWQSTFDRDVSNLGSSVAIVRSDLGLPPPPKSG